jgi:hypothetical protein
MLNMRRKRKEFASLLGSIRTGYSANVGDVSVKNIAAIRKRNP